MTDKKVKYVHTHCDNLRPVTPGVIIGFGNPLLDVSSPVPASLLQKYDLQNGNAILAEDKHLPLYEELVKNYNPEYIAGGATQNSIRVAQWMLQTPHATHYVGAVGKGDAFGQKLREAANKDGVTTLYYEHPGIPTGTCAVLIVDRERSLVANLAAANTYKHSHTESPEVQKAIGMSQIIYSAGFFITVPEGPTTMMHCAKHAAEHNKYYCLNLAAPFIVQFFTEPLMLLMPYVDYLFGNETEAKALGEKMGWGGADVAEVALRASALPKANGARGRVVVFTQGMNDTIVAAGGRVIQFPVALLPQHLVVDTNGAGDAFVGGFLSQLARGAELERCIKAGNYAARVVIQHSGCKFHPHPDFI